MDVTRLDLMIENGEFFRNPALLNSMNYARDRRLHLMGLIGDGGVHAMDTHLLAIVKMAKQHGVADVCIHCFMDGRDTPPDSGAGFVEQLQKNLKEIGAGRIATVNGRYYAMDRDKRWERVQVAFRAMVLGEGPKETDPVAAIRKSYQAEPRGDEYMKPVVIVNGDGAPSGTIRDEDACIFFNFRADRAREISRALTDPNLDWAGKAFRPKNLHFTTMTEYEKNFPHPVVLPREIPSNILSDVLAGLNLTNLRTAETEKYAHVTYFFNGGNEKIFPGEERELVPSPKVATYDMKPEMSAFQVKDVVIKALTHKSFDVIVVNFANADMVGHCGRMEAATKAVEAVDACLGEIHETLRQRGGAWIVTADHGNSEQMIDPVTKGPHTYHTTNPVPLILMSNDSGVKLREGGSLQDITPTILGLMGVPQPAEMKGRDLRII
jgi:2,3-bisphosphoglycerate-independent phosphoglycerate mutase